MFHQIAPGAIYELHATMNMGCTFGEFVDGKPAGLEHVSEETWQKLMAETTVLKNTSNRKIWNKKFLCLYALTCGMVCICFLCNNPEAEVNEKVSE